VRPRSPRISGSPGAGLLISGGTDVRLLRRVIASDVTVGFGGLDRPCHPPDMHQERRRQRERAAASAKSEYWARIAKPRNAAPQTR
jgi:hypothetical protein